MFSYIVTVFSELFFYGRTGIEAIWVWVPLVEMDGLDHTIYQLHNKIWILWTKFCFTDICKPSHPSNLEDDRFYFLISSGSKGYQMRIWKINSIRDTLKSRLDTTFFNLYILIEQYCMFVNNSHRRNKKIIPAHKAWSVQSGNRNTIPLSWPTMWHKQ